MPSIRLQEGQPRGASGADDALIPHDGACAARDCISHASAAEAEAAAAKQPWQGCLPPGRFRSEAEAPAGAPDSRQGPGGLPSC